MKISAILIDPRNRRIKLVKLRDTWPAVKQMIHTVRIFQYGVHGHQLVTSCEPIKSIGDVPDNANLFAFRLQPKVHFHGLALIIGPNTDVPQQPEMSVVHAAEKIVFEGDYGFECRECTTDKHVDTFGLCNDCAGADLFVLCAND